MALVTCPDCNSQVSDIAPTCPRCGRPIAGALLQSARTPQYEYHTVEVLGPGGFTSVYEPPKPKDIDRAMAAMIDAGWEYVSQNVVGTPGMWQQGGAQMKAHLVFRRTKGSSGEPAPIRSLATSGSSCLLPALSMIAAPIIAFYLAMMGSR